jgi:hypothetical protein
MASICQRVASSTELHGEATARVMGQFGAGVQQREAPPTRIL